MEKYLTPEQEAEFINQLNAPAEPQPTPEAENPVEDNSAPEAVDAAPMTENPLSALFDEFGVTSAEELAEAFRRTSKQSDEYKGMLAELLAFQKALDTKGEIEPDDPMNTVKQAVREEMAPIYEKLQREAQNKIVQEAWGKDAVNMPDLADAMPEITAFLHEHPELSVENDGLRRAYDRVRSMKYKSEAQMLADDDFIARMAANEKVKDAVIKEYLANAAKSGGEVPASISGGGNVPLTGKKQAPGSFDEAKSGLARLLGANKR